MERWWEVNGEDMVKVLGKDVIGHTRTTSKELDDPDDVGSRSWSLKSQAVQAMFAEDCVSPRGTLAKREESRPKYLGPATR